MSKDETKPAETPPKKTGLFVDGREVGEKEYLGALKEAGYNIDRMPKGYRPSINTKK